jgi:hypothetical protein
LAAVNGSKPALRAPRGLSESARERWRDQAVELEARGRLTPALRELLESWARSLDAAAAATAAWTDAGMPESETGSTGQRRQHHLRAAKERADRHIDNLTAAVERASNRRVPRNRIPIGARVIGRLVGGGAMIVARDGRVYQQSVVDASEWVLSWDELRCDDGWQLRWMGEDGAPVFHDTPPTRSGWEIREEEAVEWAELRDVPVSAVLEWYSRPNRKSKRTIRDDIDIARYGLAAET